MSDATCSDCGQPLWLGQEVHPTVQPRHVRCPTHGRCYPLCVMDHPDDFPERLVGVETKRRTE